MKKYLINISIIVLFILSLLLSEYIIMIIGKTNYYNYQDNKVELRSLKDENKLLKKELNSLKNINNLDNYIDYDYLKSEILLRDIYNFHESITIRYGKDKSLKKGMAVVSEKGLIGIIDKVNKKSSVVKLITAKDSNISIAIDENYGILKTLNKDKNYLVANNFNNFEVIMKNDEVYTSGLGLIPEGIYIGKVINTKDTNNNIEQEVYIKSENDINNLKYVAIIKGLKEV